MRLVGDPVVSNGVAERHFEVQGSRVTVPGIVWTPEGASGPRPLVLVGHGAGDNKRTRHALALVDHLVMPMGYAVAAIDMIGHGDRDGTPIGRPPGGGPPRITPEFIKLLTDATEETTGDWDAAITGLRSLDDVGSGPLGYWGISMGTIYGIPLAATRPDVRGAVFGTMGTFGGRPPWSQSAGEVRCPVLFLVQKRDGLIRRRHSYALYRQIGSRRKRRRVHPGIHSEPPDLAFARSAKFFRKHLR